jgi:hypothetical protein
VNTSEHLDDQLRAHVAALTAPTAAVNLLIAHRTWLRRTDFLTRFTFTATDFDTGTTSTGIEWAEAINALGCDLTCSGGEARLLRIAASLAKGIPVDLHDAMTGLDHTNTALVASAVTRAAGH